MPAAALRTAADPPLTVERRRQLDRLRGELSRRQADWRQEERQRRCPTGLPEIDGLLGGGFTKGLVTSLCGAVGAGTTSLVAHAMARATAAGESCAWVDAEGSLFAPALVRLGVELARLLWVRPPPAEVAWTAQLLARSGAFALVAVDGPEGLSTGAAHRLADAVRAGGGALVVLARERPVLAAVKLRLEATVPRPLTAVDATSPPPPRRQVRLWVERSAQGGETSARVRLDPGEGRPHEGFRPEAEATRLCAQQRPGPPSGTLPLLQLARRLHTRPASRGRGELAPASSGR